MASIYAWGHKPSLNNSEFRDEVFPASALEYADLVIRRGT